MKQKINYFKELSKTVIQQNNNHISKVEKINDILFAHRPTKENLHDHKMLINDLLQIINEKRDRVYLLESDKRTLEKELNFWITDYDKIKYQSKLREKGKAIDMETIKFNIDDEMSHKQ